MKTRLISLIAMVAALIVACDPSDDSAIGTTPRISISVLGDVPATMYPGESVRITFVLKNTEGIKDSYVSIDGQVDSSSVRVYTEFTDSTSVTVEYRAQDNYAGNTVDIAVGATGLDGAIGHYDVPLFVLATKPSISVSIPETAPSEFKVSGSALEMIVGITSQSTDIKCVSTYKNDVLIPEMSFDASGDLKNQTLAFSYTPTLSDVGEATVFKIEVMDVNGNIVESLYSVIFTKEQSKDLNEYSGVSMSLQSSKTFGNFFDATNNIVYPAVGVSAHCADIDWVWFYSANGSTIGVAIASINAQNAALTYSATGVVNNLGATSADAVPNWTTRNETNFRELDITVDEFAAISTAAEIESLFANGTIPINALGEQNDHVSFERKVNTVTAFKIRTGKYGVIKVTAVGGPGTGFVKFDYKIEK